MYVLKNVITRDLGRSFAAEVERGEMLVPIAARQSLRTLSDDDLLHRTKFLAAEERRITSELLEHLREVEVRRLYAREGFASLFEYVHRGLGFSEGSAGRRVEAMRLTKPLPEAAAALAEGRVSLSNASALQHFLKREKKVRAKEYSKAEQAGLLAQLENRSSRECEKILVALSPVSTLPQERERVVTATDTELRFVASDRLMKKLAKLKALWAHQLPNPSYAELFERLIDRELERIDPEAVACRQAARAQKNQDRRAKERSKKGENTASGTPVTELEKRTQNQLRYIPASLRRAVWLRDRGECQHRDPKTGRKCSSRYQLQWDHIRPFARGG